MSLNLLQKKNYEEKNWNLVELWSDPDPHQNEAAPKHCLIDQAEPIVSQV